ncbi:hypothetical protein J2T20_005284 [Paenibacillus wynnii]|nr:hypothetical protein [Paenibacillus wynnii]
MAVAVFRNVDISDRLLQSKEKVFIPNFLQDTYDRLSRVFYHFQIFENTGTQCHLTFILNQQPLTHSRPLSFILIKHITTKELLNRL